MDWLKRMNRVLDYIEDNLTRVINKQDIAKLAYCSEFQFQRLFSILTDVSLSEYIRRRRLTQAAFELQNSCVKIIDLALKYGYESPESFSRAFQLLHGITPSVARNEGVTLKSYPRIIFQIMIKGDVAMKYKIIKKEGFSVYGIEETFTNENEENLDAIPKFWETCINDGRFEQLIKSTNIEGQKELCPINAICDYRQIGGSKFPYMLFAFKTERSNTSGYTVLNVPSSTWAVFRSNEHSIEQTSTAIQELIKRVYTEWLPSADFEKIDGYELEMYYDNPDTGKCFSEVWLRVRKN